MPWQWWSSAFLALLAISLSPGNGAVLSMRYGLKGGVLYAMPVIWGLQIGLVALYVGVITVVLVFSREISPRFIDGIALLGGGYLCYLGGSDLWRALSKKGVSLSLSQAAEEKVGRRILTGVLTNLTNPKGILFVVAFFPQWLRKDYPLPLIEQALLIGGMATMIDLVVMHGYSGLAATLRVLLADERVHFWINLALGGVLIGIGLVMGASRFVTL